MLDFSFESRFDPEQRVVGDVKAQHFLFESQLLGLVEGQIRDLGALVEPAATARVVWARLIVTPVSK